MARVTVVGGGLGGMASAARLAKAGHQVTLVEQRPRLGGALAFVESGGYRWDAADSTTTLPAALRDLFRKSGRPLEREVDLVEVHPLREHRFADGSSVALPSLSRAAQREAVDDGLGAGLGEQWLAWTRSFTEVWERVRTDLLERPYDATAVGADTVTLLRDRVSLHKAVTKRFRDERLRALALHHAVQAGHDPRNVPWWMGLLDHVEQGFGTWTVAGGLGVLAEVLADRLSTRGVQVLTETIARDVVLRDGRAVAVRTSGGDLDCDVALIATDPRHLPALSRYVERSMPALPPSVCHVGLVGDVPPLPSEVVLHGDPVIKVTTGGTAPPGAAAWTIQARGRLSEDVLVAMARLGIDIRQYVEVRVDRSPRQQVEEYGGSPYGVLWQGRDTLRQRLSTRTPLPNVYVAGAAATVSATPAFVALTASQVAQAVAADTEGAG